MENLNTKNSIKTTIAKFNNFPPLQLNNNTENSVIYFCESHTTNPHDRENIAATSNLLHRMGLTCCEKYELPTGYLSLWNYFDEMSKEEIDEAIHKGYEDQEIWLKRYQPESELPNFMPKDWKDCISEKENPYYQQSKEVNFKNVILEYIIEKLPCHVYWLNRENVYLGCNEEQAKDFGLKSRNEIIGKTNFDFHDYNTAVKLNRNNELVMSTGKSSEVEESGYILGEEKTWKDCLTKKIPLFDVQGKIVGLLGISFDITARKKAEELRREEELYEIQHMMLDDSCSPAIALEMLHELCKDKLCKEERAMLEMAMERIEDIPAAFIKRYRKDGVNGLYDVRKTKKYRW